MSVQNLKSIEKIQAKYKNGQIVPEESYESIFSKVTDRSIVILKDVFPPEQIADVRRTVHQWGQKTPVTNPENPTTSWHRVDDNPAKSQTKHRFTGYMFSVDQNENLVIDQNGQDLGLNETLMPCFKALGEFQSKLTKTQMTFSPVGTGHKLQPQIIHYPVGGGFFDQHVHSLEPQKVGLILGLSQQGKDFKTGGTRFKLGDEWVSVEGHMNMGDITIFKYDLVHDVSIVDKDEKLDWSSERGRWTMVIPFKVK